MTDRLNTELRELRAHTPANKGFVFSVLLQIERRKLRRKLIPLCWFAAFGLALAAVSIMPGYFSGIVGRLNRHELALLAIAGTAILTAAFSYRPD